MSNFGTAKDCHEFAHSLIKTLNYQQDRQVIMIGLDRDIVRELISLLSRVEDLETTASLSMEETGLLNISKEESYNYLKRDITHKFADALMENNCYSLQYRFDPSTNCQQFRSRIRIIKPE